MVSIEKYEGHRAHEVSVLSVKPEQAEFTVGNIADIIANLEEHEHPHLILFNGQAAGFFILDLGYSTNYDFCPSNSLGVRALLVDHQFQGIAQQALVQLPSYTQKFYANVEALYLTVNCRNQAAYHCYAKCGFQDTGDLYVGGPAGPQYIMNLKLIGCELAGEQSDRH